jgi:hypothetical protein
MVVKIQNLDTLRERYRTASPYSHIVIDNFLPDEIARDLASKFPKVEEMSKVFREPMSYKGQTSDIDNKAPQFSGIFSELQSSDFLA